MPETTAIPELKTTPETVRFHEEIELAAGMTGNQAYVLGMAQNLVQRALNCCEGHEKHGTVTRLYVEGSTLGLEVELSPLDDSPLKGE